jgi:xanthine dehydrogenase accessory factor
MNEQTAKYFSKVEQLRAGRIAFVSVILVHSKGHAPQDPAAKMLVTADGLTEGTVGGGKIEAFAIRFAQEMLLSRAAPVLKTWNLQTEIGMSCGGEVSLFFEPAFTRGWSVTVFGAGHVAQAVARLLINLDCSTTFIDPRPEWIAKLPESPRLKKIMHAHPAQAAAQIPAQSQILVMTQGHSSDFPILKTILLARTPTYIGAIGSDVKARKMKKELLEAGVSAERLAQLNCPVGLTLGDNSPEEIAISIVAQLIQVRDRTNCDRDVPSYPASKLSEEQFPEGPMV